MIQVDALLKISSTAPVNAIVTTTNKSATTADAKKMPGDVRSRRASWARCKIDIR